MPDDMGDALRALVGLELKIGELYEACALRWPEDGAFWHQVAQQETVHARAIERMAAILTENQAHFLPAKAIRVAAIDTIVTGIEKTAALVRTKQFSKLNALATAVDIENSLMEKKFYELFPTADPALLQLCQEIREQTKAHKERFERRIDELKT